MEHSDLFNILHQINGVSEVEEAKLKVTDEDNYFGFGGFKYSSDEELNPYDIIYGVFRKPQSLCINLSISFVFEDFKEKIDELEKLRLIDHYNMFAIGIKAHSMEHEKDDELHISLNTEFYSSPIISSAVQEHLNCIAISLRFLENAPLSFSNFLKARGIVHDYLTEAE
ncbi:hypothetical protein [Pectobacterium actinidiae]|uniref:hypothetical protein n=1 Tax=Pectobacterium actinidiae TaxID=1507808 RepID=UPI00381C0C5E